MKILRVVQVASIGALSLFLLSQGACKEEPIPIPPATPQTTDSGVVSVWQTNSTGSLQLVELPQKLALDTSTKADLTVAINEEIEYQSMEGFGASITGSSAFVIQEHLSENEQKILLQDLFNTETGIGLSFIRLTIGASDFSLSDFTYNDLPSGQSDIDQDGFDLSREDERLVPLLQKIIAINPAIKIMGSPWSAPAWMKETNALKNGGTLRTDYMDSYATYFIEYIKAMESRNIPIHSITVQNEPLYAAPYISLEMSSSQQRDFIRDHLGPKLAANNLSTKIIIYDHNWDNTTYPIDVLSDPEANKYIEGTAFHCYAGDVSAMSDVHRKYPNAGLYFTECSGGDFSPDYATNLSWNTQNLLVGATRNWSKTVLFWNMALDQNHGPKNGGCQDCRGVVTVNSSSGQVTKNVEYALLGHVSKFVKPGAKRIETPDTRSNGVSQVAFKNQDGSITIIAMNHNNASTMVRFENTKSTFVQDLSPGSLYTFHIKE